MMEFWNSLKTKICHGAKFVITGGHNAKLQGQQWRQISTLKCQCSTDFQSLLQDLFQYNLPPSIWNDVKYII